MEVISFYVIKDNLHLFINGLFDEFKSRIFWIITFSLLKYFFKE